ncbi:MAG: hypothetical protein JXA57_19320 [Armatimonadetes bacterium]|nr:hypothetical protein [Armatimonadota bacterium]
MLAFVIFDIHPFLALALFVLYVALCVLVGRLARRYLRSPVGWFLLAFFFAPLIAFIFLLVASTPHCAVLRKQREDAVRERHPDASPKEITIIVANEATCPKCDAPVNLYSKKGLHASEKKPWIYLCDACAAEIELNP